MTSLLVLGLSLADVRSGATTAPPPARTTFSVKYAAAADCPSQATFEAAILARAPRATQAAGAADVRFEVILEPAPGAHRLRAVLSDGTTTDREIADDGCTEAMQSMAIISAMMLEAQPRASVVAPALDAQAAPEQRAKVPDPAPLQPPLAARLAPARSWLSATAGATAESAAAPSPAFGALLGAELGLRRAGLLLPSVRVSLIFAQAATVNTTAGDARFRLLLARTQLCGLRLGDDRTMLRFCALVDAGALNAQGVNARNQRAQSMPWLALGLGAIGSVGLSGPVSLELGGGARGMLVHDDFVFAPATPVHEVPVFAWNSWIGLSMRAW